MTMQVGMVGSDGVLIASDTQWTQNPRLRNNELWAAGRGRFNAEKIIISRERGMAISRARSMETASRLANEIIAKLEDEDFMSPIGAMESIAAPVLRSAEDKRDDAQCLIALQRPSPQLFFLQFGTLNGNYAPIGQRMETIAIAGDNLNAAIFWVERYYEKRPVERLVRLAAHLVCTSRRLNTATISGLEIVVCTGAGIRRISPESINELMLLSDGWDRSIGDLFLAEQQLTYAPDAAG